MKLTALLLCIALTQVSAKVFSQISLKANNTPFATVVKTIQQQSGYVFVYNSQQIQPGNITAELQNASLEQTLKTIFQNKPISYQIIDKNIVLLPKPAEEPNLIDKAKAYFAQVTVIGKVQDELGQPMVGVTVTIKATNQATVTDKTGVFQIVLPNENTVIVFSYIGYETQELRAKDIPAGSTIILKATSTNLQEIVINKGYYKEKQELATGSVSRITSKDIEKQPVSNILQVLEGQVPGLFITQTNGQPGGSFTVQIRGKNSLTNGSNPFYVIDGVPYYSQTPLASGNSPNISQANIALGIGSPLNFINPGDIESVEVLKDADATALYGSRAANGAILITTKRGKSGKTAINADVSSGFTSPTRNLQLLNTQQYLAMRHEAFKNDGATASSSDYDINGVWDTTRYTDWQKELIHNNAYYTNAQLSLSGGTTNTQFLVGGGFNRQTTGFKTLDPNQGADEKGSVHFSINHSSEDQKFKMVFTGSYLSDRNTVQVENFTFDALNLPPDAPALHNADGSLNWAPLVPGQPGTFTNPLALLNLGYKGITSNLVGNSTLTYLLFKNLNLRSSFSYSSMTQNQSQTSPTTINDPAYHITSGDATFNQINVNRWSIEPQIDYSATLGNLQLAAFVGASFDDSQTSGQQILASNFISDALINDPQSAGTKTVISNNIQYKYNAVRARLNLNWLDKYIINITANRDGSSRFGPGKQFGNFGSIGAAWIFTKEKWLDNLQWLSFGKIRGSYGITGNDQIQDYQFLDLYGATRYTYAGTAGLYPKSLFNSDLAWEIDRQFDGGVELSFFKDRINIQADYYRKRSDNQLVSTPLTSVTGYSSIVSNLPATVQNSGFEFTLRTQNINTHDFKWTSSFNLTINRNKLVDFPGLATSGYQNTFTIGQPITIKRLFQYAGVDPQTGVYQFRDVNGAITFNPNSNTDRTAFVDPAPKFYSGLQNSITYHSLTLDFLFQFVKQKGPLLINSYATMTGLPYNVPVEYLDAWHKPGDQATYEKFSQTLGPAYTAFNYALLSNFSYGDASFIRLKNVQLSWTLDKALIQGWHVQNCSIFLQGQNLLTFTKYVGIDPESQGTLTPPMRIWTVGLRAGF